MTGSHPRMRRELYRDGSTEVGCILDCWNACLEEEEKSSAKRLGVERIFLAMAVRALHGAIQDFPLSADEWRWVSTLAALWYDLGLRGGFLGDVPPDVLILAAESLIKCLPPVATEES